MQRLIVKNFGPLKEVDIPIKDLTILIGPNGSGKSLLGKLVYFFHQLPDYFFGYVHSPEWADIQADKFLEEFLERIIPRLFRNAFGSKEFLRPDTEILFSFDGGESFLICSASEEYLLSVQEVSPQLLEGIQAFLFVPKEELRQFSGSVLWDRVYDIFHISSGGRQHSRYFSPQRGGRIQLEKALLENWFMGAQESRDVYGEQRKSLLDDYWMTAYYPDYQRDRTIFEQEDWDLFFSQERKLRSQSAEGLHDLDLLVQSIASLRDMIGGDFVVSKTGQEFIITTSGVRIPMQRASSGQHEVTGMWPGLLQSVLNKQRGFFFVEEPEAHLYPKAQQQVVNALALTLNAQRGNQLLVTTHSPYVLAAFDNLIQANEIAAKSETNAQHIQHFVPKDLWIPFDKVSAFFIDEMGHSQEMKDFENNSIGGEPLDNGASQISSIYDQLLEFKYPLES